MKRLLIYSFCMALMITRVRAQLVINGAVIKLNAGAALVINNFDNNAIIQNGSGYISSEENDNKIIWNIGSGNGNTYLIPFGNADGYLPIQFTASSGSADGYFIFSTYPTPTWKNSDYLPPGVTNVNAGSSDNSAKVIDRFWQINPQGYTEKPTLTNIVFTYVTNELSAPNTITESNLMAQRWNNVLQRWDDYFPASSINTGNKTITISSIPGSQLYDWWTMVDADFPLPVTLINFKGIVVDKKVVASWQTASETNTDHFEIWKSKNLQQFYFVTTMSAAGNSATLLSYQYTDGDPYSGTSFYRLKSVDRDGKFSWSGTVKVVIEHKNIITLFPNPVDDKFTLSVGNIITDKKIAAFIYNAKGDLLRSFLITKPVQELDVSSLPSGVFYIKINLNEALHILKFIKK